MRNALLLLTLVLSLAASACDEKLSDVTGPTPNLTPTFSSIQREIFNTTDSSGRAACIQCHVTGGGAAATGLILTDDVSYGNLVNRPSRLRPGETLVIPGDPDNSYIVRKLEGGPDHHRLAHAAHLRSVPDRRPDVGDPPLDRGRRGQ